jgi:hypothetical protein
MAMTKKSFSHSEAGATHDAFLAGHKNEKKKIPAIIS